MAYTTGVAVNLGDILDAFVTFLTASGWTVDGHWRDAVYYRTTQSSDIGGLFDVYHWRYARYIGAHKGSKYVVLQDFYTSPNLEYGTVPGNSGRIGPGIAMVCGDGPVTGGTEAGQDPNWYTNTGATDGAGPEQGLGFASRCAGLPGDTTGIVRTVILPLPPVLNAGAGTWAPDRGGIMVTDGVLAEPFSDGAAVPSARSYTYWFMSDASGDNVILVVQRPPQSLDGVVPSTPYLFFGDIIKAGNLVGGTAPGRYFGASHSHENAFNVDGSARQYISRFGAPGETADGGAPTFLVRVDVDTTVGKWPAITNSTGAPGTGRRLCSTTIMPAYAATSSSGTVFGVQGGGVAYASLNTLRSSLRNSAPMLPIKILAERDNGMWSVLGEIPEIYHATTFGFVPGTEAQSYNGDTYLIFDGFAVRKHV